MGRNFLYLNEIKLNSSFLVAKGTKVKDLTLDAGEATTLPINAVFFTLLSLKNLSQEAAESYRCSSYIQIIRYELCAEQRHSSVEKQSYQSCYVQQHNVQGRLCVCVRTV